MCFDYFGLLLNVISLALTSDVKSDETSGFVFIFEKSEVNFHSASVPLHRLDVNVDCQVVKAHEDVM